MYVLIFSNKGKNPENCLQSKAEYGGKDLSDCVSRIIVVNDNPSTPRYKPTLYTQIKNDYLCDITKK